jgi:uncharacterized membrane protein YdfJ with MMPL/SSD domain
MTVQKLMDSLTALLERRRWLVFAAWVVLLLASLPFAVRQTDNLTSGGQAVPGSGSHAVDVALEDFDAAERQALAVVVERRAGGEAADVREEIARVAAVVDREPGVELSVRARRSAEAAAEDSRIAVLELRTHGGFDRTADLAVDLRDALGIREGPREGTQTYLVGQQGLWAGFHDLTRDDLLWAETIGFPIVLLILLAVFGSMVAAALPLALAGVSVAITGAGIFFLSQVTDMSLFVTNFASMVGIGVAVDYSLFVLARYREEIAAGADPRDARRVAMRTSGVAVAFSGVTVVVALAGLFLVESPGIRSMAMATSLVVAVSILAAMTLLPVLLSVLGRRGYQRDRTAGIARLARRLRPSRRAAAPPPRGAFWQRWTERVTRRPLLTVALCSVLLLTLAAPALWLQTGDSILGQFPEGNETRVGAELMMDRYGAGATGPVQVVATFAQGSATDSENRRALAGYALAVQEDPAVTRVARAVPSDDGRKALLSISLVDHPESLAARDLVLRLRDGVQDDGGLGELAELRVGGVTATNEDFRARVTGALWKVVLFAVVLSYLVLCVLLRSVLLPLKAVLMNLLSVAAAYGVLVAIFQWGWLDGYLGFQSLGHITTVTPPFLLAIVFGLSMDYEVFLLTRIKERYESTGDSRLAIAQGLARSAGTISSAALIMVAVFAVFAGVGIPAVKEIGVGLAVAIALDATIVRLVLVPATMEIMGRWNWWLPRPLDRVLPDTRLEAG